MRRAFSATPLRGALVGAAMFAALLGSQAARAADSLPKWAIGPFARYAGNPILKPQGTGFESLQTFNPGVVRVNGVYHMLYRGTMPVNISAIGAATSTDGIHFTRYSGNPVIAHELPNESVASEDPRLLYRDGTYYTFYTGFNGSETDLNEATSTDALHWHQLGAAVKGVKNGAVVSSPEGSPVTIDGQFVMYYGSSFFGMPGVAYATSPDMIHWTTQAPIDLNYPQSQAVEVCVAVTDYPTAGGAPLNHNVLLFTAGHMHPADPWYYAISEEAFSRTRPTQLIGQLAGPVLQPTTSYETVGVTPAAVFMNNIIFEGGEWRMYYGAGDTVTALATSPLRRGVTSRPKSSGASVAGPAIGINITQPRPGVAAALPAVPLTGGAPLHGSWIHGS